MEQEGLAWIGELLSRLENTPLAVAIAGSDWAFPIIETVHVIALALLIGTVCVVDLRLLGLASKARPYCEVARESLPWAWIAFAIAVASGTLLFITKAVEYSENAAFRAKLVLLLLAGLNMLVFEFGTARDAAHWDSARSIPWAGRVAAALSLILWVSIVFCGRRIGFTMTPS
ncbi:MAG TPA: DUF6644 family protein [Xanthobacteraceae bacterium]|nr:DUF6644 family protein [Xanthobacteraceae bacterium]